MFSLQDKQTIITGGGSGIGKAIATLFAKQGAQVNIIDVDSTKANDTVDLIRAHGGKAAAKIGNIVDQDFIKKYFEEIGIIDILVNSAGIAHIGNAENTTENDFQKVFDVNVRGVYNTMHLAIPGMRKIGSGVILNLSSIATLVGLPDRFAYSMSKGAVTAMTLSVARDFMQDKIRCNSISPARVHTPFVDGFIAKNYPGKETEMFDKLSKSQPIGRMGTVDEIAALALYLCSDQASFITGNDYPIDGGFVKLNT